MVDAQCVILRDMLYVGGWVWSGDLCRLFVSRANPIRWRELRTPTSRCALATFHSQLVLIGGYEANTGRRTSKLWTSDAGEDWKESLPPMPTKRHSPSAVSIGTPEHLVVAGGSGDDIGQLNTVEVLTDNEWWTAEPLPRNCCRMKSTLHNGKWYLMGGQKHDTDGYYCDVKSLLLWRKLSSDQNNLWVYYVHSRPIPSSLASFGEHLISIGCGSQHSLDIAAFSPFGERWMHVNAGQLPEKLGRVEISSIVLQTGELVIIGEGGIGKVFKGSWKGENY